MSGLVMGLVWELPIVGEFGRAEKYILLAYADHADQNGKNIFPSVDLISAKTGYAERAVQNTTRTLQMLGYLVADGIGPHGTNRFAIPVARVDGGAKIAPLLLENAPPMSENAPEENAPPKMSENAPEGNAPEENAPETIVVVKDSTTTAGESGANFDMPYPETMIQAYEHPAIVLFQDISGIFPGQRYWNAIVDSMNLLCKKHENLRDYLAPYWLAWSTRTNTNGNPYNPLNPAWLTEWALSGQIPPTKPARSGDGKHRKVFDEPGQKPTYSEADQRAADAIKLRKAATV